jgi:hypothetical protein
MVAFRPSDWFRQRGEADIHAIQIGDEIADHQEGDQPRRDFADGPGFELFHGIPSRRGFLPGCRDERPPPGTASVAPIA